MPIFKKFGFYVFGMPVTSKENQIRGSRIWGLPKVTQEIDIHEDGEALAALNRTDEAEANLQAARARALAQGARGRLWRVQTALGRLYRSQARDADAQKEFSAAKKIITELAAQIEDNLLRENFIRRAHAMQKNSPWSDKAHAD